MARTGFTKQGNLEEVSQSVDVIKNLLTGDARPFAFDDVQLFRNNFNFTTYLDFIPDGNIFKLQTLNSAGDLQGDATRVDVEKISNACPQAISLEQPHLGGTLNLAVEKGDAFLNSPTTGIENLILAVNKSQTEPDVGSFITNDGIQGGEDGPIPYINAGDPVFIKKKNNANYSPGTGRFTFAKGLEFQYSNGDLISGIYIKGFESPFNISPRSDTPSIYPLKVSDYRRVVNEQGVSQFSFILRLQNGSPLLLKNSPSIANATRIFKDKSPYLLRFDSPDILRFERKLPVNANDFFGNAPPLFRASSGPQTFVELDDENTGDAGIDRQGYSKIAGFEDLDKMYNIGQNAIGTGIGYENEASAFTDQTVVTYNSAINTFISSFVNAQDIANTSIISARKNFYNNTEFGIKVDGSLIIQDPKIVNSPRMYTAPGKGNLFSYSRLAPAVYIQESNLGSPAGSPSDLDDCPFLYRRAFSTFDGPWSSVDGSSNATPKGAEIFTQGNSPAHPEYVKALSVNGLEFEDDIQIEKYGNQGFVTLQKENNANASRFSGTGFEYKMPITIAETDPITGEIEDATYFLLLRSAITFDFTTITTTGVTPGAGSSGTGTNFVFEPINGQVSKVFNPGANVKYSQANAITITGGKLINITHGGSLTSTFNTTTQTLSFDSDTASIANTDTTFTYHYPIGSRDLITVTFNLEST